MIPFFMTCIFALINISINAENYIIIHPENQIAKLGSTITLQCRVKVIKKIEVHWVKNEFGFGSEIQDIRQFGKPKKNAFRYDLPFNLNEGEYDLRITDLMLSDEGEFYCQMKVDGVGYSSKKATVEILIPSLEPKLMQNQHEQSATNPVIVKEGGILVLDCIAEHGRPGAKLYWFINDVIIEQRTDGQINGIRSGRIMDSVKPSIKNKKLYNSKSTLSLSIKKQSHGSWIKCIAKNKGFENETLKPAMTQIEVHTLPVVKMKVYPTKLKNEYIENDIVEFSCTATGRPNAFSWKWYRNNQVDENINTNKLQVRLTRMMNNFAFKCVATSTGTGSDLMKIIMKYGPRFIEQNNVMYGASIGETVVMICKVDSNPASSISWRRETSTEVISRGHDLEMKNIQEEDFGIYRCTAVTNGFSSIFKNAYLVKKKKPLIIKPSVSYGREGQSARLSCTIESVPLPKDNEIKWIFRNKIISKNKRHKSYQQAFNGGVVAVLQILSLNVDDFGDYNCTVLTSLGTATRIVILLQKGGTPVLMIVGTLILFLFILLMITVVLHICKNGKYKNNYKKGNTSSYKVPEHHDIKSILIDSDCHSNPNLFSLAPRAKDLKNNSYNQERKLLPKARNMNSSFLEYKNKEMEMNKHRNIHTNLHFCDSQKNTSTETTNFLKHSSLPQNSQRILLNQKEQQNFMYQNLLPNYEINDIPILHRRRFPLDYYFVSKPSIKSQKALSKDIDILNPNNTLISEYASNI